MDRYARISELGFKFCPSCGRKDSVIAIRSHELRCPSCGWRYFHNIACASGCIIMREGKVLFLKRGLEPSKGKLGLPGGFVDANESLEEAVARECEEEVGVRPDSFRYLCSFPNTYPFAGIPYSTCDVYFVGTLPLGAEPRVVPPEIVEIVWRDPHSVSPDEIAFESMRKAMVKYLAGMARV